MNITKDTKVADILKAHGDIADVMEIFGVKRVAGYSVRKMLTKAISVEWAARIHRDVGGEWGLLVPLSGHLHRCHHYYSPSSIDS